MEKNYGIGSSTIDSSLKKIGYSRKKRVKLIWKEEKKNELVYVAEIKSLEFEKLVFVDESRMNDNDFYLHTYIIIKKRHYEAYFGHYKKRISMIGGLCNRKFIAPFMFKCHCNTSCI